MPRKLQAVLALLILMLISFTCFANVPEMNKADAYGRTPLTHAVYHGDLNTVRLLLNKGADTHIKDISEGRTILMTACEEHYIVDDRVDIEKQQDIIALLLDIGQADIDEKDNNGSTALMRVAHQGRHDIVRFLIKRGAKVNIENNNGSTPLIEAIRGCSYESGCRYESVKAIIDSGANVNVKDKFNNTPFYYSKFCNCEKKEVQHILKEKGANDGFFAKTGYFMEYMYFTAQYSAIRIQVFFHDLFK